MARSGIAGQLRNDPVAFSEEFVERRVGDVERALLGRGELAALGVEHAHAKGGRALRDLAADLAEPDDAERRLVQHAHAADARPVRIRRVAAVEGLKMITELGERLDADAPGQPRRHLGLRQHQTDRMLGAGDVGAPPQRQDRDAAGGGGVGVDIAQAHAIFLHHLQPRRARELLVTKRQRFDHDGIGVGEVRAQLFGFHQPHLGCDKPPRTRPHARAPAREVRLVVGEEIGVGCAPLGAGGRIEHDLDQAQKHIVLDDKNFAGGRLAH